MPPETRVPSPDDASDLPEQVNDDIGAVQGADPDELSDDEADGGTTGAKPGSPSDAPAPDAGEIEWAGQLIKKPPTPGG